MKQVSLAIDVALKVPKITDSTKKMIDEFIAMPTNDKKALMKFLSE